MNMQHFVFETIDVSLTIETFNLAYLWLSVEQAS